MAEAWFLIILWHIQQIKELQCAGSFTETVTVTSKDMTVQVKEAVIRPTGQNKLSPIRHNIMTL